MDIYTTADIHKAVASAKSRHAAPSADGLQGLLGPSRASASLRRGAGLEGNSASGDAQESPAPAGNPEQGRPAPMIRDANDVELGQMSLDKNLMTAEGRLLQHNLTVTDAASPRHVLDESLDPLNSPRESDEGDASFTEMRVKPPEYWHAIITEARAFTGKNMSKQFSFAENCVKRNQGDTLVAGRLALHLKKIQSITKFMSTLTSSRVTFKTLLPAITLCVDEKVQWPVSICWQLVSLFLTEVVDNIAAPGQQQMKFVNRFLKHWLPVKQALGDDAIDVDGEDGGGICLAMTQSFNPTRLDWAGWVDTIIIHTI
jgi:hypothetical protein